MMMCMEVMFFKTDNGVDTICEGLITIMTAHKIVMNFFIL